MTYELQPGTIAHVCAKYLRTLKPGVEISTAELATAIGQPSSAMLPSTQAARNHGLIRARYREDNKQRHLWWSVGDGVALEKPAVDDSDEDDGPLGKPFAQPPATMRSVFDLAQATGSPPAGMRVAIWSDGAIQIRRGDNDVAVLSPSEAKQVVDALDRMLGAVQE